jgi:hypothetical protein
MEPEEQLFSRTHSDARRGFESVGFVCSARRCTESRELHRRGVAHARIALADNPLRHAALRASATTSHRYPTLEVL